MPKTVLITGVLGRIGSAISRQFRDNGYYVYGLDKRDTNEEPCDRFIQFDINEYIKNVEYRIRFTDIFEDLIPKLDVLINNADVKILSKTDDIRLEDWQETMNVNLTGPMLMSRFFLKKLEAANGSIINIGSIHSSMTMEKHVSYTTSKAALIGLTKAMAVDLVGRVRVNAISPAQIKNNSAETQIESRITDPIKNQNYGEDVAKLAIFLASEKSGVIHGSNFNLDGGISSVLRGI